MKRHLLPLLCLLSIPATAVLRAENSERVYLSGRGPADAVPWDFFCSSGHRSGEWTTIPVPSNWEQHGFGGYNYGFDDLNTKHDETGTYRTTFMVPNDWKARHVRLVFEGSMTETSIKINGQSVGAPNLGGYIPFRYLLDEHNLIYGKENTLEVLVKKKPSNASLDWAERTADYWVFGGIYRPVYLEIQPKEFVDRLAIDARADGTFNLDVFPQVHRPTKFREDTKVYIEQVIAQIETTWGAPVGKPMIARIQGATGRVRLRTTIEHPPTWSPERPQMHQVRVQLLKGGVVVSEKTELFGFRTFEHRPGDGLYLNGRKLLIRGVNRNTFNPEHGRSVDAEDERQEAREIKAMNANLVRSHLPPTPEFSRACDELGLLVITELTNWHDPIIDTPIARNIAYEIVTTYQNHPSVILWANGNENGFNLETDELFHLYDLQDRPVIHPWSLFEGIDTLHYPKYVDLLRKLRGPNVYLPTEFLHGLYDGGHGAGLEDYWREIRRSPFGAGGVLWCWKDDAIRRTDLNRRLDTYGNKSADGIVGPHREKEASYFTVREIWSPVQIPTKALPTNFNGSLPVENRHAEISLHECQLHWRLVSFPGPFARSDSPHVQHEGRLSGPAIPPGATGQLSLPLPGDWSSSDALELTAFNPQGELLMTWSWPIEHEETASETRNVSVQQDRQNPFKVRQGDVSWTFSSETGQLLSCDVNGTDSGLGKGPVLYAGTLQGPLDFPSSWAAKATKTGDSVVIDAKSRNTGATIRWTLGPDGRAILEYDYPAIKEAVAYCAVGFDFAESNVVAKSWLGKGPHRVWGNRIPGPIFGRWNNAYNDNVTGQDWGVPEFKGIFDDVKWMRLDLKSGHSILLSPALPNASIGVLRPRNAAGEININTDAGPVRAWWHYPVSGNLHVFHKLPGVGTKFSTADQLGPQGEPVAIPKDISGKITLAVH